MEHLDNLAIMNYLQGHGLSGGGLIGGWGTSAGYEKNQGIKDGLAKYRAFIDYEKNNNGASHQEALAKWKSHKPKHAVKKEPKASKKAPKVELKNMYNVLGEDIIQKQFKKIKKSNKTKDIKNKIDNFKNQMLEFSNVLKPKKVKKSKYPTKNISDKGLVELNGMRLPELRKYAKKYITLSKVDKTTGKRIQLKKKEIIKKLGAHN